MVWFRRKRRVCLHKITIDDLTSLFKVAEPTVRRWIRLGRLDPSNLLDIIDKYNNRHLLDHRRKPHEERNP
jgi:hypothetical protein